MPDIVILRRRALARRRFLCAAVVALGLAAGPQAWAAEPALPEGLSAPAKPAAMPAFDLPTTTGKPLDSNSLKGQVLVIRFWASWCTICRGEMPSVQRTHDAFKAAKVSVLAISIDGTGVEAAKPVMTEGRFDFPAPVDQDMTVARKFGVRGVPMTFVIDRKGNIVAQGAGPIDFDAPAFRNYVKAIAARAS